MEIINHIYDLTRELILQMPYLWIFVFMSVESSFIPFPSEIVMIPAWYLAATWDINIYLAIITWISWSIFWALVNYWIARRIWPKLSVKLIWKKNNDLCEWFFCKYWDITTFIWRLIPVVRQYISFPAWAFKMNLWKFILFTALGAWIWTAFLAYLGWILWDNQELIKEYKLHFFIWVIILAIIITLIKLFIMKRYKNKR